MRNIFFYYLPDILGSAKLLVILNKVEICTFIRISNFLARAKWSFLKTSSDKVDWKSLQPKTSKVKINGIIANILYSEVLIKFAGKVSSKSLC